MIPAWRWADRTLQPGNSDGPFAKTFLFGAPVFHWTKLDTHVNNSDLNVAYLISRVPHEISNNITNDCCAILMIVVGLCFI